MALSQEILKEVNRLDLALSHLKSSIGILDDTATRLHTKDKDLEKSIHEIKDDIFGLTISFNNMSNSADTTKATIEKDIQTLADQIKDISLVINDLSRSLNTINNNTLLNFTSDFDVKKLLITIATMFALFTSPQLITGYVFEQNETDQIQKIDRLIELLENP